MQIKIEWKITSEIRLNGKPKDLMVVLGERYIAFQTGEVLTDHELAHLQRGINLLLNEKVAKKCNECMATPCQQI